MNLYLQVYFIWVTQSQKHFEWLIDILRQVEEVDKKGVAETHIFITQMLNQFDLRTTMLVSSHVFHAQKLILHIYNSSSALTSIVIFCSIFVRSTFRKYPRGACSQDWKLKRTSVVLTSRKYLRLCTPNTQRWIFFLYTSFVYYSFIFLCLWLPDYHFISFFFMLQVKKVGVFSCGPPGLTKGVHDACYESSKHAKARFEHHFENFWSHRVCKYYFSLWKLNRYSHFHD